MESTFINIGRLREEFSKRNLKKAIKEANGEVTIVVPLSSVGVTNWPVDIAQDYIVAMFVGEKLSEYCSNIKESVTGEYYGKAVHFKLEVRNVEGLVQALFWLACVFNGDDEEECQEVYSHIADFEEGLQQGDVLFPELGDSYLANYVNGIDGFDDEEYVEEMYALHPEWNYRFWRSFTSRKLCYEVYASAFAWIIPHSMQEGASKKIVEGLLEKYCGFESQVPAFQPARWLTVDALPPIVLNQSAMISYPIRGVRAAQECAAEIWHYRFHQSASRGVTEAEKVFFDLLSRTRKQDLLLELSDDGEVLLAHDTFAYYLFFKESTSISEMAEQYSYLSEDHLINTYVKAEGERPWVLPRRIQKQYLDALDEVSTAIQALEGNPVSIGLSWDRLNDDLFEQLCYDIIGQSEMFDPDSRRRMGKSRARDGGRDIEVLSRRRLGSTQTKWIVQCKYTRRGQSLSGSKVQVSDVVDQYAAGGFSVMTNAPIDSTLHDKLERIAHNRKIEFDEWDGMRMERVLARPKYSNIRKRYFDF